MRKFIMDKYNLIAFAIGLIPTILLYLFPPDAAVPFWAFSIVLFFRKRQIIPRLANNRL